MLGVVPVLAALLAFSGAPAAAAGAVALAPCPDGAALLRQPAPGGATEAHCAFPDGRLHGPRRVWDAAGALVLEESYRNGLRHGPATTRGPTGAVVESGAWEDGARVGRWVRPAPDGGEPTVVDHRPPALPAAAPAPSADGWSLALGAPARALIPSGDTVWVLAGRALRAVDAATGAVRAEAIAPDPLRSALITGPAGAAAALTTRGEVLLLDGTAARRLHLPLGVRGLAALDADRLVVVDGAGRLHAVDPLSGAPLWTARATWDAVAPVRLGGLVIVGRSQDLRAVALADGARRWQRRLGAPITALAPGRSTGRAFVATADGRVHRLDPSTGESVWTAPLRGLGRPVSLRDDADGLVVLGADAAVRLDPETGAEGDRVTRPKSAADEGDLLGSIACHADRAGLVACAVPGGPAVWAGSVGPLSLPPVRVDGAVWLAGADGVLHARRLDDPEDATHLGTVDALVRGAAAVPVALPLLLTPSPLPDWLDAEAAGADPDAPPLCSPERLHLALDGLGPAVRAAGIVLPDLVLERSPTEEPPRFADGWSVLPLGPPRWNDAAFLPWAPQITAAQPLAAGDAAAVDALLACAGPGAVFHGTLTVFDGAVRRSFSGRITLEPDLSEGPDGLPSCLIAARHADEPLGWFSGPAALGWVRVERWVDAPAAVEWSDGAPVEALGLVVRGPDGLILDSVEQDGPVWTAAAAAGAAWELAAPGRLLRRWSGGLPVPTDEPVWVEDAYDLLFPGPLPDGDRLTLADVGGCPAPPAAPPAPLAP